MQILTRAARFIALVLALATVASPSIQYAGGTNVNSTFTQVSGSRQELIGAIETALTTAGWSTLSGAGSGDVLMRSAATPAGLQCRVRLYEGVSTTVEIYFSNGTGTATASTPIYLLPAAAETWRVVANRYQLFVFTVSSTTVARKWLAGGVPYVPSFSGVVEAVWSHGNSDNSGNYRSSFRTVLSLQFNNTTGAGSPPCMWHLVNGTHWGGCGGNSPNQQGWPTLVVPAAADLRFADVSGYRWYDDSSLIVEPLIAWGISGNTNERRLIGQLWDAVIVTDAFFSETTYNIDSRTFFNVTNQNLGCCSGSNNGIQARGSLLLLIP